MYIPTEFANIALLFQMPNGRVAQTAFGVNQPATSPSAVAAALDLYTSSAWWDDIDSSYTCLGMRTTTGTGDPSEPIVVEVSSTAVGGNGGDSGAPQVSYLVKKLTDRGGRQGRGRMFHPGIPRDYYDDAGALVVDVAGQSTDLFALISAMAEEFVSGVPVLFHATEAGGAPDEITSLAVDGRIATQRRRMR